MSSKSNNKSKLRIDIILIIAGLIVAAIIVYIISNYENETTNIEEFNAKEFSEILISENPVRLEKYIKKSNQIEIVVNDFSESSIIYNISKSVKISVYLKENDIESVDIGDKVIVKGKMNLSKHVNPINGIKYEIEVRGKFGKGNASIIDHIKNDEYDPISIISKDEVFNTSKYYDLYKYDTALNLFDYLREVKVLKGTIVDKEDNFIFLVPDGDLPHNRKEILIHMDEPIEEYDTNTIVYISIDNLNWTGHTSEYSEGYFMICDGGKLLESFTFIDNLIGG